MKRSHFKILILMLCMLLVHPLTGLAVTKQHADDSYHQGNYQQAISDYKSLLDKGVSPALYYNLGNAYYRSDSLSKAILCYQSVVNFANVDTWAVVGIGSIVIALVLMLCYLFASPLWLRKTGFFGSVAFLLVFVFSTLFAWQQKYWFDNSRGAIVMSPAIGVKSAPEDKTPDAYVIHEGTRVNILDDGIKGWKQIQLGDGREGWIKSGVIEMI